jgi:hypothetical protein
MLYRRCTARQRARFAVGKPNIQLETLRPLVTYLHHSFTEVLGMSTPAYRFPSGKELSRMPYLASARSCDSIYRVLSASMHRPVSGGL